MTDTTLAETTDSAIVLNAIRDRRSIGKVTGAVPPVEVIEQILEAGTWAPNHHLTQPWRFFVLMGEARNRLGAALADAATEHIADEDARQRTWAAQAGKPLRAPVLIAIAVEPAPQDNVIEVEEIAAAAAAGQNMLLAAQALGLGAMWRSGQPAYSRQVHEFFNLSERGKLLGFIYLGYPAMEKPTRERLPIASVTQWLT
jgi:nitroreductase